MPANTPSQTLHEQPAERSIAIAQTGARVIGRTEAHHVALAISPRVVSVTLGLSVLALSAAYAISKLAQVYVSREDTFGLYRLVHLGAEANLPAYFSALLILMAAVLCGLVALHGDHGWRRYWLGLHLGMLIMSFDEAAQIHEGVVGRIFAGFAGRGEGIWHWGWYIPFIPLVVLLAIAYVPFLKALPRKQMVLFAVAGCVYVGGAVGVEMIQSYISYHRVLGGAMATSLLVEETCEMMGFVVFIYAILSYMAHNGMAFTFKVG